ncbi:MAG: MlaE family lipid ABC transporter permease subunit [Byssovorax sp.]
MSAPRSALHPNFDVEFVETDGAVEARLSGKLAFVDATSLWTEIQARITPQTKERVTLDLSGVESIDGGTMALLVQTKWDLQTEGGTCEFVGATGHVQKILDLYEGDAKPNKRPKQKARSAIDQLGQATADSFYELQLVLAFLGSMILAIGGVIRRPKTGNWHDIAPLMNRTGADAVPIVLLINFLIGFVMGFQSAVQLKQFGANIFVADLVGLSITRELGPLMTAIIVCGRSGAAFAAELGTMKVSEEVDALRTMGFGPWRYLVIPRMLALILVMPILTLLADLVGICGGLLVGLLSLDLTITGYLNETRNALHMWDIFQGLIKAAVFGFAIGLIACQQGLATSGGAEGVGRRTTAAVVTSLFALILLDAGFTMLFYFLKL